MIPLPIDVQFKKETFLSFLRVGNNLKWLSSGGKMSNVLEAKFKPHKIFFSLSITVLYQVSTSVQWTLSMSI